MKMIHDEGMFEYPSTHWKSNTSDQNDAVKKIKK